MSILPQVPEKMQTILQTVADEVAPQTGCVKRNRKLTSALAQTLVFGWLEHPEASYQQLPLPCSVYKSAGKPLSNA